MLDILRESFFINGIYVVLIASVVTAPLGSMMVWNRLSYMGDSIAHSSLLGVGLATFLQIDVSVSVLLVAVCLAISISFVIDKIHSIDAILNIITSVVMSVGIILLSSIPSSGDSIVHSLFGDILMISGRELLYLLCVSFFGLCLIIYRWRNWIAVSISYDLALSAGLKVRFIKMEILVMSALAVVMFAKTVGILLTTSFLIIPASAARVLSKTPLQMVFISAAICIISGIVGLLLSVRFDTFPGPMTIITAFFMLIFAHMFKRYA